eukprot:scaffold1153_cov94-Isochrysis_galbana.AAC.7
MNEHERTRHEPKALPAPCTMTRTRTRTRTDTGLGHASQQPGRQATTIPGGGGGLNKPLSRSTH